MPVPRTFTLHAGKPRFRRSPCAERCAGAARRDEAKRAEQSRADFVANATHELRSPLAALIGFIETLRGRQATTRRPATASSAHADEAQRMARLIEDLMSLSRVEINEHVPPRDRVDLGEVLGGVVDILAVRAEQRRMAIMLDVPGDLPAVLGDMDQLTQVFHNLVDNAVKYARPARRSASRRAPSSGCRARTAPACRSPSPTRDRSHSLVSAPHRTLLPRRRRALPAPRRHRLGLAIVNTSSTGIAAG